LLQFLPNDTVGIQSRAKPVAPVAQGHSTSDTVGLRVGSKKAPSSFRGSEVAATEALPVWMLSGDNKSLAAQHFTHNFTYAEMSALNYAKQRAFQCTPGNTVFDLGFYDGADSKAYLDGGFCVVGIEADPYLVQMAVTNFAVWLSTGQLRLGNVALSPEGAAESWTTFYMSKCTKEWNSFYHTVGCRSCEPPHVPDPNSCTHTQVKSIPCTSVFHTFGQPHYLKLDIEGAEPGCFAVMKDPAYKTVLPTFVSSEITELSYLDTLYQVGYRSFKLVRQDYLHSGLSSHSGPWGNNALDCRGGATWRTYAEVRAELALVLLKPFDPSDKCPGGICPVHGQGCNKTATSYMWYDVHVTWGFPPKAGAAPVAPVTPALGKLF